MKKTILDQPIFSKKQALYPFALTDVLTEYSSQKKQMFMHFWQLDDILILGMKDTRVNDLTAGLATLTKTPYLPIVRNSGGLGVIADNGILNISVIIPKDSAQTIDAAYEFIFDLTQRAFPELKIESFEISNSYCPGTYDLSVDNKKIAGTAQRRIKDGVAIMMYLSVNGNQMKRGEIVRQFYRASLGENFGKNGYPPIDPTCMTTVADLLNQPISVENVKQRFMQLWHKTTVEHSTDWLANKCQTKNFAKKLSNMQQRNEQITMIEGEHN